MTRATLLYTPPDAADRWLPEGPKFLTVGGAPHLVWLNLQSGPGATDVGAIFLAPWPFDKSQVRKIPLPGRVGFLLPTDRPDVVLLGAERALELWDLRRGAQVLRLDGEVLSADGEVEVLNEACVVPGGDVILCGTKDPTGQNPIAGLYRYKIGEGKLTRVLSGQKCSNGKFAHDHDDVAILYDIDSPSKTIARYRYDLVTGEVTPDGVTADLTARPDYPDGMVDCGDRTALVGFYHGDEVADGSAVRYDLGSGREVARWVVPGSPKVTCPVLVPGEGGGVDVAFTTAIEGMSEAGKALAPWAGSLFRAPTGLAALPAVEVVRLGQRV